MPNVLRLLTQIVADRIKGVVIAIAAGKNDDTKSHDFVVWGGTFILPEPAYNRLMRRNSSGATIRTTAACLLLAGLVAYANPAAPEKFAGTWEASAKGTVFLVLKITTGQKISGTMQAGHVEMNDDGDLIKVGPPESGERPIFFAEVDGDKLKFNFQDDDEDVLEFELKLAGDDAGELRIVDKDHPGLKGFAIKRAKG